MCEVSQRHEANNIFMTAPKLPPGKFISHAAVKPQAHFLALGSLVPRLKLERQAVQDAQGIRKSTSRSSEVKEKKKRERESWIARVKGARALLAQQSMGSYISPVIELRSSDGLLLLLLIFFF